MAEYIEYKKDNLEVANKQPIYIITMTVQQLRIYSVVLSIIFLLIGVYIGAS
jgi:uncharacterized membrane protein